MSVGYFKTFQTTLRKEFSAIQDSIRVSQRPRENDSHWVFAAEVYSFRRTLKMPIYVKSDVFKRKACHHIPSFPTWVPKHQSPNPKLGTEAEDSHVMP